MHLTVRDVPEHLWASAARIARKFVADYPEATKGPRGGAAYKHESGFWLYVYRTSRGVTVRGEDR